MKKNILILGLGAFGFAIAKHLGENNPQQIFHASEVNTEIFESIQKDRKHPYFFNGATLPDNIKLCYNTDTLLPEVDIIISVIPCQFLGGAFTDIKHQLKDGVTILNLSK
jgi:glycerol-3-phosphate dehydrogenase